MFSRFVIVHLLLAPMFVLSKLKSTYYKDGVISCKRWAYHQTLTCKQLYWLWVFNRLILMLLSVTTSWTLIFHIFSIVPVIWRFQDFPSLEESKVTFYNSNQYQNHTADMIQHLYRSPNTSQGYDILFQSLWYTWEQTSQSWRSTATWSSSSNPTRL